MPCRDSTRRVRLGLRIREDAYGHHTRARTAHGLRRRCCRRPDPAARTYRGGRFDRVGRPFEPDGGKPGRGPGASRRAAAGPGARRHQGARGPPRRFLQAGRRPAAGLLDPKPEHSDRAARTASRHRPGAEEHHRALDPGGRPAGHPGQQAGARQFRRDPAERSRGEHPAAQRLRVPGDAEQRPAGRLPVEAAQSARLDRHRLQVSPGKLRDAAGGRRRAGPCPGAPGARRRFANPRAGYRGALHHPRRDGGVGAYVPCRASRFTPSCTPTSAASWRNLTRRGSGSSRRPP